MKLYYLASFYQLLIGIVHVLKTKGSSKIVFLVDSFLINSCKNIYKLVENKFIEELYDLPFLAIKNNSIEWVVKESEKNISSFPYRFHEFDEIFVGAAHSWFGIYLSQINVEFNLIEESSGILSKISKLRENVSLTSATQDEYAEKLGLYQGNNDLINKVLCSSKNTCDILSIPKVEVFNLYDEIKSLSDNVIDKIISIFVDNTEISLSSNCVLLLTQHFANLGILEWEEQKELYRIILDYFTNPNDDICIKTHPADIMDYKNFFNNCEVITDNIPSELLPFMLKPLPKAVITVSSTAIDEIGKLFGQDISFDFDYEQWFPITHSYYCVLQQIASIIDDGYKVYTYGTNYKLIYNLNHYANINEYPIYNLDSLEIFETIYDKQIYIIDDFGIDEIELKKFVSNMSNNTIIFYIN